MKQILLFLLLSSLGAVAQDSTGSKPQVKLGLFFNSNLNYFGRTDSLKSAATFMQVELWITKGLYLSATPILVHNTAQRLAYAGTTTSIGYQHLSDSWLGNISVFKPIYKTDTDLAQSLLKLGAGFTVSRLNHMLNVTLGGDLRWSNSVDLGATAGIDRIFRISSGRGSAIVADPSLYAYGGTQGSSTENGKKDGNDRPAPGDASTKLENRFTLLAYEASLPLIFVKGKLLLMATPSYIAPKNLVQVPGRPELSESGENSFSLTLGVKYTF